MALIDTWDGLVRQGGGARLFRRGNDRKVIGGAGGLPALVTERGYTTLAFEDDFTDPGTIDLADTRQPGFNWYLKGQSEAVARPQDITVADSVITITRPDTPAGVPEPFGLHSHVPGTTVGKAWRFGYFEARMKWDPALALHGFGWPAFWGRDWDGGANWTITSELDIFEAYHETAQPFVGAYSGTIHNWAGDHYSNAPNTSGVVPSWTNWDTWHTYGALWEPGRVQWFFDGQPLHSQEYGPDKAPVPNGWGLPVGAFTEFDKRPQYLIFGAGDQWPLSVDYIRVWQRADSSSTLPDSSS